MDGTDKRGTKKPFNYTFQKCFSKLLQKFMYVSKMDVRVTRFFSFYPQEVEMS